MSDVHNPSPPADGPEGIGGWLVLPMLGMFITPLQSVWQFSQYTGLIDNFAQFTSGQKAFLLIEIACIAGIAFLFPVVLLFLFFNGRRAFPRLYVVWAVLNMIFIVGDLIAAKILFGHLFEATGTPLIDAETTKAIVRAVLLMVIWVPYMLTSRRVRNTFVR